MEANKDSALNYIELAEKAIQADDYERASRYLNKAESLFPTQKAKDLLQHITSSSSRNTNRSENSNSKPSTNGTESTEQNSSSNARYRGTSTSNHTSSSDYTNQEAEAVRKIKTCKDLYEILGVSKTANEADLKKAYRKLALQFHPDKCKAPGATDAFKAIGKAFSVLSDPKKREQYDRYGSAMEPQYERTSRGGATRGGQYYYYADEDDDFSAEEIFNMFFGHGGPTTRVHRHRHPGNSFHFTTHSNHPQAQASTHTILQVLPYLLLFLISILGSFFVSEPQFQLHRTNKYSTARTTRLYSVEYFVKPDFRPPKKESELDKFENSVIEEYISELRHQCYREQQYKESLLWRARMMNDNNLYREAQKQGTPSCTSFNEFVSRLRA